MELYKVSDHDFLLVISLIFLYDCICTYVRKTLINRLMRKPNLFNLFDKGCDAYNVNYNISATFIFVVKPKTRVDMYKEHNKRSLLVILLGSRHEARSSNNVTSWPLQAMEAESWEADQSWSAVRTNRCQR